MYFYLNKKKFEKRNKRKLITFLFLQITMFIDMHDMNAFINILICSNCNKIKTNYTLNDVYLEL